MPAVDAPESQQTHDKYSRVLLRVIGGHLLLCGSRVLQATAATCPSFRSSRDWVTQFQRDLLSHLLPLVVLTVT